VGSHATPEYLPFKKRDSLVNNSWWRYLARELPNYRECGLSEHNTRRSTQVDFIILVHAKLNNFERGSRELLASSMETYLSLYTLYR